MGAIRRPMWESTLFGDLGTIYSPGASLCPPLCQTPAITPVLLHPRKWRTRAPVLTGGPGAAPGGVVSKNRWVYMRVQGGFISCSLFCLSVCT